MIIKSTVSVFMGFWLSLGLSNILFAADYNPNHDGESLAQAFYPFKFVVSKSISAIKHLLRTYYVRAFPNFNIDERP